MTRSIRALPRWLSRSTAGFALAWLAAGAFADLDVSVGNGDKVAGTLSPGTEQETIRVVVPRHALLNVSAKGVKSAAGAAPAVTFSIFDPDGSQVGGAATVVKGAGAKLKKLAVLKSGEYRIVVSGNGVTGGYAAQVSWTSRSKFPLTVQQPGSPKTFEFAADAGATASFSVKAGKGNALPRLFEVRDSGGALVYTFTPPAAPDAKTHAVKSVPLATGGDLRLLVTDTGGGDVFAGAVTVKAPKSAKRQFSLTTQDLPAVDGDALVRLLGPGGGVVGPTDIASIAGASVGIPAGAMAGPTAISIGVSTSIDPGDPGDPALGGGGPSVFFGPEGLAFLQGLSATVTIPYDPAAFPNGTGSLRVFTRSAAGVVTEVTPVTVNAATHTVSVPTSHFSSFQAFKPVGVTQRAKLVDANGFAGDRLGFWVGLSGSRAVAGAFLGDDEGTVDVGIAHVFHEGGSSWTQEAALFAGDGAIDERFAESVAIDGPIIVVGASQHPHGVPNSGAAYVYELTSGAWAFKTELRASVQVNGGLFGGDVAISGNTAVIGSVQAKNATGDTTGGVYVFTRTGSITPLWSEEAKIVPDDAAAFGGAGSSVVIQGDTLAFGRLSPGGGSGAVWVYTRTAGVWSLQQKLEADTPVGNDAFGKDSIALDGDTLIVGVPRTSQGAGAVPEAYVFVRSGATWTKQAILANVGGPVAVAGDSALVASPLADGGAGTQSGFVSLYRRSGVNWSSPTVLVPNDAVAGQGFGAAVAMDATRLLVSAVRDNALAGAVYVFDAQ